MEEVDHRGVDLEIDILTQSPVFCFQIAPVSSSLMLLLPLA